MTTAKIFLIIISIFIISGCASNIPKEVKIPIVAQTTKIKLPEKPYLPIADLKENSTPDVVMKSYIASLKLTQGYSDQLNKTLEGYQ